MRLGAPALPAIDPDDIKRAADDLKRRLDENVGRPLRRAVLTARIGHYVALGLLVYIGYKILDCH